MDIPNVATLTVYALVAAGTGLGLVKARSRLALSRAKHRSIAGHSRMSKRLAALIPFYEFSGNDFFQSDGAPEDVAARRRASFEMLAADYRQRFARTIALKHEIRPIVSDMQFTDTYRVPFPYSRRVRDALGGSPFLVASRGVVLTDVDGNAYYDVAGSYGVNLLGYDAYKAFMSDGAAAVSDLGPVLGFYHPVVAENVMRLKALSGLDEVSFHMSGTEAVMQAVRLARYHTGRKYLVRFCGAYHGWWGDVQPGVGNPERHGATYTLADMSPATLDVLRRRRDIACVLVNPLQALHPNTPAPSDSALFSGRRGAAVDRDAYARWLSELRTVCSERGIVLIFDEVFLGFRLARGGAQEYFGVKADIVTYGKTLGGGLPVGVVCGRADLMRRYRDDRPADICFARGTFNSHPYVLAAMQQFLRHLDTPACQALYRNLDATWEGRAKALNERLEEQGLPVRVAALSTVWVALYTQPSRYHWMFQFYLRKHGLALSWVGTGRLIFSLNYTAEDFAAVADRFVAAATDMQRDGWWWRDAHSASPARIGRKIVREMIEFGWLKRPVRTTPTATAPVPAPAAPSEVR